MKKALKENDLFRSTEMPLVAMLVYFGYSIDRLQEIEPSKYSFVFIRAEGLDTLVQQFWADSISVSPKKYFFALKEVKSRIFAEKRR